MVFGTNIFNIENRSTLIVFAALFSILLSGCGGGGGGGGGGGSNGGTSNTKTIAFPLTVSQTTPLAIAPGANGDSLFTINTETGAISGLTSVSGLTGNPTAAYIRAGSIGSTGEVVVTLDGSDESISADGINETWRVPEEAVLNATDLASYSAGELYVSVHTEANDTGELRGQFLNGSPAGSYTFTITNSADHQPLTAPIVFIRSHPRSVIDVAGTPGDDGDDIVITDTLVELGGLWYSSLKSIVEDANNESMVGQLEQFSDLQIVHGFAVAFKDRANPGYLLPGESTSVTLTPGENSIETQVFGLVSKVLCSNDGYTAVDFQVLPTGELTISAPAYDLGTEINSTQLDTWVEACGGTGNTHVAEEDELIFLQPQLHPGQSGTQIPPDATTSIYDFAMGDEFLKVTITPN